MKNLCPRGECIQKRRICMQMLLKCCCVMRLERVCRDNKVIQHPDEERRMCSRVGGDDLGVRFIWHIFDCRCDRRA